MYDCTIAQERILENYMDIEVPQVKKVTSSEEATREALISISYPANAAETLSCYKDGGVNNREKYMYELISISDSQSPDSAYPVAAPVVDSGNHKCY
ncbi:hypothetical protein LINPERHAP2_LOCUS45041 [Linum perenne]